AGPGGVGARSAASRAAAGTGGSASFSFIPFTPGDIRHTLNRRTPRQQPPTAGSDLSRSRSVGPIRSRTLVLSDGRAGEALTPDHGWVPLPRGRLYQRGCRMLSREAPKEG